MKSSGSKTLSVYSILILFASIFFVSCGLPKDPFILDKTILIAKNFLGPIALPSSRDSLEFSIINIDNIYTTNGINFYFIYTNDENPFKLNNTYPINSTVYSQNQTLTISDKDYHVYVFKIDDNNENSLPTIQITDILPSMTEDSLYGYLTASLVNSVDDVQLHISIDDNSTSSNSLVGDELLLRYSSLSSSPIGIINADKFDGVLHGTPVSDYYYLHIFGSYYAKEPSEEFHYDNIVADTKVTYLGSVELQ